MLLLNNGDGLKDFSPNKIEGLIAWFDASKEYSITEVYSIQSETVSGTSGTNTLTASADVSSVVYAGQKIRVNSSDEYIVDSVSTVTITTVQALTSTYSTDQLERAQVSQKDDLSYSYNSFLQATSVNQPILVDGMNGKKSFRYDGIDEYVESTSITLDPESTNFSIFIVFNILATNGANQVLIQQLAGTGQTRAIIYYNQSTNKITSFLGAFNTESSSSFSFNEDMLYTISLSGNDPSKTISLAKNLESPDTNTIDPEASNGGISISLSAAPANMLVSEFIYYSGNRTEGEIRQIKNYLIDKWGIS